MTYRTGSEAAWLDGSAERQRRQQPTRTFEVFEGAGLDARAREGVGLGFVSKLTAFFALAGVVAVLCFGRVAISAATVSVEKANETFRSEIATARSVRADLEVQRSVLAASTRIDLIATQNLGMELTGVTETIDVSDAFGEAAGETGAPEVAIEAAGSSETTVAETHPDAPAEEAATADLTLG